MSRDSTELFLDAIERRDLAAAAALFAPDVTWFGRMNVNGGPEPVVRRGRDEVVAWLTELHGLLSAVRFVDRRLSDTGVGTVFLQANGDFRTADGRPYRNVYVFRFDWRDGQLVTWEEYANPVTITATFAA